MASATAVDVLAVNTIRTLSIDAIQRANSGHPGLPLGAAPMAYALWQELLRFDPREPSWPDRDRFVLSAGHGSMLLYSLLHLYGYDLTLDDLRDFRQWGSRAPGHPETFATAGVECTTGPLGQGTANAVGLAVAERWLAQRFNRPGHEIVDHYTYALVSDGDLMEGIAAEAASLAGHWGLGKLIYLYDANDVTLDGPLDKIFSEDVAKRYEASGWGVWTVEDGDTSPAEVLAALNAARADTERPSLIVVKTTIGYGSPNKAGSCSSHGAPLGDDEVALTKEALGWPSTEPFHVPDDVRQHCAEAAGRGAAARAAWQERFDAWAAAHPELAAEWKHAQDGTLPDGWDADFPAFEAGGSVATRAAGGKVLQAVASGLPNLIGGDADLGGSTKTVLAGSGVFDGRASEAHRNIAFGVREHAMGAIANGMAYHGGVRPYTATFFVFSDYMRPAMRLAAMNDLPAIFVFTHDSVAVGEDGPTHQPVEHLMSLRAMPGLHVVRPADATETAEAWRYAAARADGPTVLVLSRQNLPILGGDGFAPAAGLHRGAYVLADADGGDPRALILATGSEIAVALEAREQLQARGVPTRVVSMPCWEAFAAQDQAYRDAVIPPGVSARVSIEAGATLGWERWIGGGRAIGIDRFGASAPGEQVLAELGITAESVIAAVDAQL